MYTHRQYCGDFFLKKAPKNGGLPFTVIEVSKFANGILYNMVLQKLFFVLFSVFYFILL